MLAHQRHEFTWCKVSVKASFTVASCLIDPSFSVDAYPNQLPDLMGVLRISMNQVWESMNDLSKTAVASGLLSL